SLHRIVGSAEVNCLGDDLLLAATGTDGLVVDAVAGFLVELGCPLGVGGVREGRARAGDVDSVCGQGCRGQSHANGNLLECTNEHEWCPLRQSGESTSNSDERDSKQAM